MPFEVAGRPATLQALVDKVLGDIKHKFCMAILHDVVIYTSSQEHDLGHTEEVLHRIEQAVLTINSSKTQLCTQSLKCLEHIIYLRECRPDPEKVAAVRDFTTPRTVKELQALLGLAGYYQNIPRISEVARPLTFLLRKDVRWTWEYQQQTALNDLRDLLADNLVVALQPQQTVRLRDQCKCHGPGCSPSAGPRWSS